MTMRTCTVEDYATTLAIKLESAEAEAAELRRKAARLAELVERLGYRQTPLFLHRERGGEIRYKGERIALAESQAKIIAALVARRGAWTTSDEIGDRLGYSAPAIRQALTRLRRSLRAVGLDPRELIQQGGSAGIRWKGAP